MLRRVALLTTAAIFTSACSSVFNLAGVGGCGGTEVLARFEQVGDLVDAANVQAADVEIGNVTKIELDKDDFVANVTLCLEQDEKVPADVKAIVRTTSLLGEKFIELTPRSSGPPFLTSGDVIDIEDTSKATELEDVFARLAAVLGTGNLEQVNRFTTAQANILRDHAGDFRTVIRKLRTFTGTLAGRKDRIAAAVDNLDSVARTVLSESEVLKRFLRSFADSSGVLADQKIALQDLLASLDRFTNVSVALLDATENRLDEQFEDLRPVLRTLVANSADVAETLRTLATFAQFFPESMPGDYLQLDVCQAGEEQFGQGVTCPQAEDNDDPTGGSAASDNPLDYILGIPTGGAR